MPAAPFALTYPWARHGPSRGANLSLPNDHKPDFEPRPAAPPRQPEPARASLRIPYNFRKSGAPIGGTPIRVGLEGSVADSAGFAAGREYTCQKAIHSRFCGGRRDGIREWLDDEAPYKRPPISGIWMPIHPSGLTGTTATRRR